MADEAVLIEPEFLKKLERLHLVAKRLAWPGTRGEHASQRRGSSLEFSDYRRYQRGDDLRYVDWNIYRRMERLFVKVFTAEEEMNIYLLLDVSRSMGEGEPPKVRYGKSVAAALGYIGLKNLDRVGGVGFAADLVSSLPLGRGRGQILKLFGFLSDLPCAGETRLETAVKSFSLLFPRPGLVILVSDLFDPHGWRAGVEALLGQRHQVLLIHIFDEREIRLEPSGDALVVDIETDRGRSLFLDAELVRRFHEEVQRYFADIGSFCLGRGVEYLRTPTRTPFEDFLLLYLRQTRSLN